MPRILTGSVSLSTALTLALIVAVGTSNTITWVLAGGWAWAIIVGAVLPLAGLFDWLAMRRQYPDAAQVADWMLLPFLFALVCLAQAR